MNKVLTKTKHDLVGMHPGLRGDVSGLSGDVSGLRGYVTGLRGDVDDCGLTVEDRKHGVDIADLVTPAPAHLRRRIN